MKRKILVLLLVVCGLIIFGKRKLLIYGIDQGLGQFSVIWNARPINEVLADSNLPDSLRKKLELSKDVRTFAIQNLGLKESDNYTTFYDQKGQPILWNVSASDKYALKPYLWRYPFLGEMPYKGFFDLKKAIKELNRLQKSGYDARVRTVSGWSTLGILKDPILSNMLERSEGQLAEVIIHELVHSTLFIKNKVDFNENLASFIGEEGAKQFLKYHFSDSSNEYIEYIQEEHDNKVFINHILKGSKKLDSLYLSINDKPEHKKDTLKTQMISEIIATVDTNDFFSDKYQHFFDNARPNNAYFMSFMRYHSQEDSLKAIYQTFDRDLKTMISALKSEYGK